MSARRAQDRHAHERFEQRAADLSAARRRSWLRGAAVVVLLGALVYLVGFSPVLTVRDVDVVGEDPQDTRAITRVVEGVQGEPLARVDTDAITEEVEQQPGVASATVERAWPRTLRVDVVARVPALAVSRGKGQVEVYDLEGVKIRTVRSAPKGVPVVSAAKGATVTGQGVSAARSLLEALPEDLRGRVRAVTVDAADHVSFTVGRTTVVWGDASQAELKVEVAQILLEQKPRLLDVSAPSSPVTR